MSPYYYSNSGVFHARGLGGAGQLNYNRVNTESGVRPVISLSNGKFIVKTIVE